MSTRTRLQVGKALCSLTKHVPNLTCFCLVSLWQNLRVSNIDTVETTTCTPPDLAVTFRLLKTCLSAVTDILKLGEQAAPPGTTFHWELRDKQLPCGLKGFSTLLISRLWKKTFSISNLWEKRGTWWIMCVFCLRRQLSLQKWWGGLPRAKHSISL